MTDEAGTIRDALSQSVSSVTVVTFPPELDPHGITVSSFSNVSLDPPFVLVCFDGDSRANARLQRSDVTGFCVNVLSNDQRSIGEHFAGIHPLDDPYATARTDRTASGAPVFEGSLAYLDCRTEDHRVLADRYLYLARVEDAAVLNPDDDPLTYYQGTWSTVR